MEDYKPEETDNKDCPKPVVMHEVQMILAEKRTSLASLRTGIAVFTLPLSVLSILIATSKFYTFADTATLLIPLLILCAGLVFLGVFLITRAVFRIQHHDRLIAHIKRQHYEVGKYIDN